MVTTFCSRLLHGQVVGRPQPFAVAVALTAAENYNLPRAAGDTGTHLLDMSVVLYCCKIQVQENDGSSDITNDVQ